MAILVSDVVVAVGEVDVNVRGLRLYLRVSTWRECWPRVELSRRNRDERCIVMGVKRGREERCVCDAVTFDVWLSL